MRDPIARLERQAIRYASSVIRHSRVMDREASAYPTTYKRRKKYRDAAAFYSTSNAVLHATAEALHILTDLETWRLFSAALKACRREHRGTWEAIE